jgi:hypothetical protein
LSAALDNLQAVMFKWKVSFSMIKPTLHRRANGPNYWWRLQLVEDFGIVDDANNRFPSRKLDDCVKWVEEKLKEWPDCDRKAWDMWDFKSRRDAEKFLTVFHLSWEQ